VTNEKEIKEKVRVFISYAKEDKQFAERIYKDLQKSDKSLIKPWIDFKDIKPGQKWSLMIEQAIEKSDFFIALLSNHSLNKRGYVQKELKIALNQLEQIPDSGTYIIPVRIDNCSITETRLKSIQWIDITESYKDGIEKIKNALNSNSTLNYPSKEIWSEAVKKIILFSSIFTALIILLLFFINNSRNNNNNYNENIIDRTNQPNSIKSTIKSETTITKADITDHTDNCFSLLLNKGWNLVSIPINSKKSYINNILKDADVCYSYSQGYYHRVNSLVPSYGYWIRVKEERSFTLCGEKFPIYKKTFSKGWHLIGSISDVAYPIISPPESIIDCIYTYDDGKYISATKIEQGKGYWLKINDKSDFLLSNKNEQNILYSTSDDFFIKLEMKIKRKLGTTNQSSNVIVGLAKKPRIFESLPKPPTYPCDIEIKSKPDRKFYFIDIRQIGESSYSWIISANPHGNIGNPMPEISIITWDIFSININHEKIKFKFVLMKGLKDNEDILVNDMSKQNEIEVKGMNKKYYYTVRLSIIES